MHKKTTNKFNAGDSKLFPLTFLTVVFHMVCNCIFIHTDDTMVTDRNPVGVFSEVVNNGLRTIKGFLAMGNPVLFLAKV